MTWDQHRLTKRKTKLTATGDQTDDSNCLWPRIEHFKMSKAVNLKLNTVNTQRLRLRLTKKLSTWTNWETKLSLSSSLFSHQNFSAAWLCIISAMQSLATKKLSTWTNWETKLSLSSSLFSHQNFSAAWLCISAMQSMATKKLSTWTNWATKLN